MSGELHLEDHRSTFAAAADRGETGHARALQVPLETMVRVVPLPPLRDVDQKRVKKPLPLGTSDDSNFGANQKDGTRGEDRPRATLVP
jgi:hypothetical protein